MYQINGRTVSADEFIKILLEKVTDLGQFVNELEQSGSPDYIEIAKRIREIFE